MPSCVLESRAESGTTHSVVAGRADATTTTSTRPSIAYANALIYSSIISPTHPIQKGYQYPRNKVQPRQKQGGCQQQLTAMWGQRKQRDAANWQYTSTSMLRPPQQQLTPRQKQQKPNVPLPAPRGNLTPSRNTLTPSRIEERVTTSPLRLPLENAINKIARERSTERHSRSRVLNRSSSRREDSSVVRRGLFEEEEGKGHEETIMFLKKYFDFDSPISVGQFIDRLLREYESLWEKFNINQIIEQFTCQICDIFGGETIEPRELIGATRENGMLGLILHVFKLISSDEEPRTVANGGSYGTFSRSPNVQSIRQSFESQLNECANVQHLKNIIQEFMELMYKEMEGEIYSKFNVEMRRMILKGREADKLLKKVQEKLVMNADYFESEKRWQRQLKAQEEGMQEMKRKLEKMEEEVKREKENAGQAKAAKTKLEQENSKLKENLQRYQNILFNKFENFNSDTSIGLPSSSNLTRKSTMPLMQRTQDYQNIQNVPMLNDSNKPFMIHIDTHFIQKDSGPPLTQTTTTFTDQNFASRPFPFPNNNASFSPLKYNPDSSRPSFEGGIKPLPKIGQYSYSPIQSRITRPF